MSVQGFWGKFKVKVKEAERSTCCSIGLQLKPGKSYTQIVTAPFRIAMVNSRSLTCIEKKRKEKKMTDTI
jgi:hypothetical protein